MRKESVFLFGLIVIVALGGCAADPAADKPDAEVSEAYDKGTFKRDMLWRYPLPENVGIKIQRDDGRVIEAIIPNSPADRARLKPGDEIILLATQPIASIADCSFTSHLAVA